MSAETSDSKRKVRHRAEQDKIIANDITEAKQIIHSVGLNPAIAEIMVAHGYDKVSLDAGLNLQAKAQERFEGRQKSLGDQLEATRKLREAEAIAHSYYRDFRAIARALFTDDADRISLGLHGRVPRDRQLFITLAHTSYASAQSEPYRSHLARYGYIAKDLERDIASLSRLITLDDTQNAAIGAAIKATSDRNIAVADLRVWIRQFRRIAKFTLREHPGHIKALNL